jgi:hypothetical protein
MSVQTFNLLGTAGAAAGLLGVVSNLLSHTGFENIAFNLAASALAVLLMRYVGKTGRYHLCSWVVVISVFLGAFPAMFFTAGGYVSAMPCFFVFAIVFTALMLTGKERAVAIALEMTEYLAACWIAWRFPQTITPLVTELDVLIDVMVGIVISGTMLFLVVLLFLQASASHLTERDRLNQELAAGNEKLKSLKAKGNRASAWRTTARA